MQVILKKNGVGKSINGRFIFIMNTKTGKTNPMDWKTKKISRVCRSIKTAEDTGERSSMIGVMLREMITWREKENNLKR